MPFSDIFIKQNHNTILGIGTDICDIKRIDKIYNRFGKAFLNKTYSPYEIDIFHQLADTHKITYLAKRFAAKEACVKALGTGFGKSAQMTEITTQKTQDNIPFITLSGRTLKTAQSIAGQKTFKLWLSLSKENDLAQAFCILGLDI